MAMAPYNNTPESGTRNGRPAGRVTGAGALAGGALFVGLIALCALVISYNGIFQFAEYGGHGGSSLAHVFPVTYTLLLIMACWVSYLLRGAHPRERLWVDLVLIPILIAVATGAMLLSNLGLVRRVPEGIANVVVAVAPLAALLVAFLLWMTVRAHVRKRRRGPVQRPRPSDDPTTVLHARAVVPSDRDTEEQDDTSLRTRLLRLGSDDADDDRDADRSGGPSGGRSDSRSDDGTRNEDRDDEEEFVRVRRGAKPLTAGDARSEGTRSEGTAPEGTRSGETRSRSGDPRVEETRFDATRAEGSRPSARRRDEAPDEDEDDEMPTVAMPTALRSVPHPEPEDDDVEASVPTLPLPRRDRSGNNPIKLAAEQPPVVPGAAAPDPVEEFGSGERADERGGYGASAAGAYAYLGRPDERGSEREGEDEGDSRPTVVVPDHLADEGFDHEPPPGDPATDEAEAPAAPEPAPAPAGAQAAGARPTGAGDATHPEVHAHPARTAAVLAQAREGRATSYQASDADLETRLSRYWDADDEESGDLGDSRGPADAGTASEPARAAVARSAPENGTGPDSGIRAGTGTGAGRGTGTGGSAAAGPAAVPERSADERADRPVATSAAGPVDEWDGQAGDDALGDFEDDVSGATADSAAGDSAAGHDDAPVPSTALWEPPSGSDTGARVLSDYVPPVWTPPEDDDGPFADEEPAEPEPAPVLDHDAGPEVRAAFHIPELPPGAERPSPEAAEPVPAQARQGAVPRPETVPEPELKPGPEPEPEVEPWPEPRSAHRSEPRPAPRSAHRSEPRPDPGSAHGSEPRPEPGSAPEPGLEPWAEPDPEPRLRPRVTHEFASQEDEPLPEVEELPSTADTRAEPDHPVGPAGAAPASAGPAHGYRGSWPASAVQPAAEPRPEPQRLTKRKVRMPVEKRPMVLKPPRPPMPDFAAGPPSRRVRSEPLRPDE